MPNVKIQARRTPSQPATCTPKHVRTALPRPLPDSTPLKPAKKLPNNTRDSANRPAIPKLHSDFFVRRLHPPGKTKCGWLNACNRLGNPTKQQQLPLEKKAPQPPWEKNAEKTGNG